MKMQKMMELLRTMKELVLEVEVVEEEEVLSWREVELSTTN